MFPSKPRFGHLSLSLLVLLPACGGPSSETAAKAPTQTTATNDQSRCDYKGRSDREVVESNGPGATVPNVRRVFGIMGEGDDRRRVLFCREIDTNLDGIKDVVRSYNDKGDPVDEEADTDYDGKLDTWIKFSGGRISKEERDRNRDGQPDETRYYVKGKLSRVQRDTNYDGKPDVWEVYADGQLERMGTDLDFDGHVDRWDRDEIAHRVAEEKERKDDEKAEAAQKTAETSEAAPPKPVRPQEGATKPGATPATSSSAATPPPAGSASTGSLPAGKPADATKAKAK
jgi:DNA-binding transcriptional MerR regulator